ncbi:phosphoglucomutase [Ruminiclostridium sufflavum DSM 19573]|uniref:Phosphoglucomutase n=1 Tax=Ruminiclostridium sufflavum DSM 19573 TaxID=1121337 RepID=A0A318XR23_9FIRM|nr:phospho-sugar mutase [Ruminiclostridium sufflavum]PYG88769.1 phosphoglucomutase [Ruminiclostridium sufflavum DSM 19573]
MDSMSKLNFWLENEYFDQDTKDELLSIKDNEKEVEDRFYKSLEFGTGGLRGIIGAGTNRINIYTVRVASQGLANYINKLGKQDSGIVIAYDSRFMSPEFSLEAAKVFCANGIKAYLFDELRPTPQLSFAVRYLKAAAGIVVTASHNPKQYNGYKVYGGDGGQLSIDGSNAVISEINSIADITKVNTISKEEAIEKGLLEIIGSKIDDAYIAMLKTLCINKDAASRVGDGFKIVYTPLHGAGNKPVRRILSENGFKNVLVVKEQELPDSQFSTVKSPNPEERSAFELAIRLASENNVDLIIGTDPDSDRVGVVVRKNDGEYATLTGNHTGCLLLEYMLSAMQETGKLPDNGFVVKTIVTTELSRTIAKYYNVELVEVLTGFKFIGEQIMLRDERGSQKYLFGFEESYGYLAGTDVRDKDAVVASMLIAEMAAYYKAKGITLYEALINLFEKYGYYIEGVNSFTLEGKDGVMKIKAAMSAMRQVKYQKIGALNVKAIRDYKKSERYIIADGSAEKIILPESDVLYYEMVDGSWFCIRPSGTEPKIKIYYGVSDKTLELSQARLDTLRSSVLEVIKPLL